MCTMNSAVFTDHVYMHAISQLRSIFCLRLYKKIFYAAQLLENDLR